MTEKFKNIECKGCKTKTGPLFQMQPSRSADDVWCEKCKESEREKRAKKEVKK